MRAAAGTQPVSVFLFVFSEMWKSFDNEQARKWDALGLHNLRTHCERGSRAETWDNVGPRLPAAPRTHQLIGDKTGEEAKSAFHDPHQLETIREGTTTKISQIASNYKRNNRLSHLRARWQRGPTCHHEDKSIATRLQQKPKGPWVHVAWGSNPRAQHAVPGWMDKTTLAHGFYLFV